VDFRSLRRAGYKTKSPFDVDMLCSSKSPHINEQIEQFGCTSLHIRFNIYINSHSRTVEKISHGTKRAIIVWAALRLFNIRVSKKVFICEPFLKDFIKKSYSVLIRRTPFYIYTTVRKQPLFLNFPLIQQ